MLKFHSRSRPSLCFAGPSARVRGGILRRDRWATVADAASGPLVAVGWVSIPVYRWLLSVLIVCLSGMSVVDAQITTARGSFPSLGYYSGFRPYYAGDFRRALDAFQSAGRSGLRTVDGAWVDAVCYRTMIGECHYRMGNLKMALEQYTAALQLFVLHQQWMGRVDWPPAIQPYTRALRPPVTWSSGARPLRLGDVPEKFPVLFGRLNNDDVIRQGGVYRPAELHTVNVHEIVRCTTLALRRRYELLGPIGEFDPLTEQLEAVFATRLTEANHWSQAWVNVQRGYALAGAGKFDEATQAFRASVLLGGQFDHPLTGLALYGLGEMALAQDAWAEAIPFYVDASAVAAAFEQPYLVEDALRRATDAQLAQQQSMTPPAISAAMAWAQQARAPHVYASLSILAAEFLALRGETAEAGKLLLQANRGFDRRAGLSLDWVARRQYVTALVGYQLGKLPQAEGALQKSIAQHLRVSPWQFQLEMTGQLFQTRRSGLSARAAGLLFEKLLREPTRRDWSLQPLEALSVTLTDHRPAFETWLGIVIDRGESERALEVADRMRRQQFFSHLPLGGRLLAFRRLSSLDETLLSPEAVELRNDLFGRYPQIRELAGRSDELRDQLRETPIDPADDEDMRQHQRELSQNLESVSLRQEALFGEFALRREYCPRDFPPIHTTSEIQEKLQPGQAALAYVATRGGLFAFMFSETDYATWKVARPTRLPRNFARLFRDFGLTGENAVVSIDQLKDDEWQQVAQEVMQTLIDRGQAGFWNQLEELIIIPDGILWYLPFEALPINEPDAPYEPLISKVRIRYLPTAGLICQKTAPMVREPRTAVALGKLYPRDDAELAEQQFEDMREVVSGLERIPDRPSADTGLLRAVWDRLVVFDDIDDARDSALQWSPARVDQGRPGSRLARWLAFPWGGPRQILLPGFHTATESGLRRAGTGSEIFLSATTLMATGAETVLISRWRTGGLSAYDLLREFLQELPHDRPASAWQRSLQVLRQTDFDPKAEPRVAPSRDAPPISAAHPFFWSGYMLLDMSSPPPAIQVVPDPSE